MRLPLEKLALELAFEHLNFALLGQAEDILVQLDNSHHLPPLEKGVLNWQFHYCLYQPCERPMLLRTLTQLHEQCERYLGFQFNALDYNPRSNDEHYQILAALKNRDLDKALITLNSHIKEAGLLLVEHLRM
jgi:DNA-binding GntR family transcriptional regulator